MDRHELNQMFDKLTPGPGRERELLRRLLQDNARRNSPMKKWKIAIVAAAAAALMVTAAAAAVVLPWIDQRILNQLSVDPENSEAVAQAEALLLPGAMALDITKEDNGATLHVTQILRDRDTIMILADFTAPEGTRLYMGEPDPDGVFTFKGFGDGSGETADFLDESGISMEEDGLVSGYGWRPLDDDNPLDNRLSLIFTLIPRMSESATAWDAASLRVPAVDLAYYDTERERMVTVYSGNWSFETPLPQKDIGWTMQIDQEIGTLDGAVMTAGELYLSPMTFELRLSREGGIDFGAPIDEGNAEENEAMYGRWLSIGNNVRKITLTTKDGEAIPLELRDGGGGISFDDKLVTHRLSKVTDPAEFQGGTLTMEWDYTFNSEESGSVTIPLDGLVPVQ